MLHLRRRGHQFAVLHAFGGDQLPGDLVDFVAATPEHDDFQTIMLVEVNMQTRIDRDVSLVLHIG